MGRFWYSAYRAAVVAMLLVVALGATRTAAPAGEAAVGAPRTFALGALLNGRPEGDPDTQAAIRLAADDVNAYLGDAGSDARVTLMVEQTGLDPDAAVTGLRRLSEAGIRLVVGPESSGELTAIRESGGDRGMVLVSHCSTAPSLGVSGDAIFRLVPDDTLQAEVIAALAARAGLRAVVPLWRDDVYGADLAAATRRELDARGIASAGGMAFDPENADPSRLMADLAGRLRAAQAVYGEDRVGVLFIAFGPEAAETLAAASDQPRLAAVPWLGTEGTAQSREILGNPAAAAFAARTGFTNPLFAPAASARSARISARIAAAAGTFPHACALAAYDAVWVAALTALAAGNAEDAAALARTVPVTAESYFGATGWTALNAAGDRLTAEYDVWVVTEDGGRYTWQRAARVGTAAADGHD